MEMFEWVEGRGHIGSLPNLAICVSQPGGLLARVQPLGGMDMGWAMAPWGLPHPSLGSPVTDRKLHKLLFTSCLAC